MRHAALQSYFVGNPLKGSGVSRTLNQRFCFSGVNFFDGNPHMIFLSKYGFTLSNFCPQNIILFTLSFLLVKKAHD
jgi:hypothetical protein